MGYNFKKLGEMPEHCSKCPHIHREDKGNQNYIWWCSHPYTHYCARVITAEDLLKFRKMPIPDWCPLRKEL